MRFGLQLNRFDHGPGQMSRAVADVAKATEAANFDTFWLMDHYFQLEGMIGPADDPMLEVYTSLGYVAGVTQRLELGALVTGVIYRNPAFLIKQVTTLDVLSGGRAIFGVGAAWYEKEAAALGFDFPSTSDRFEMLEDTLKLAHQMWSDDRSPFKGEQFELPEPICRPQPVRRPPILIGGSGEKKTLRMVAQYADACNMFAFDLPTLKQKLEVLDAHCDRLGRDPATIERTALLSADLAAQGTEAVIEKCGEIEDLGVSHIIVSLANSYDLDPIERFGSQVISTFSG